MKKIFVLLFGAIAASQAFAAGAITCNNGTASAVTGAAGSFVIQTFTPKCSANVQAAYEQNAIAFVVAATSTKVRINLSGALVVAVLLVPPVLPAHARRLTLPVRRLLHWRLQRNFLSEGKSALRRASFLCGNSVFLRGARVLEAGAFTPFWASACCWSEWLTSRLRFPRVNPRP